MKPLWMAVLAVTFCACALNPRRTADLADRFDCLREGHLTVVAAHRGQPDQSAAENAMSSFTASVKARVPFLEIDVATTSDGVLALMHDDTLDRTTTGHGAVKDHPWAEIQALRIRRPDGATTDDHVPRLADVLAWGRTAGARFELDVKRTTRFSDVVAAVHAARMEDQVIVVTYTLADAQTVHALDPHLMISITFGTTGEVDAAQAVIDPHRILGWTGTREPAPALVSALRAAGIEPMVGTLGRPGDRLDDRYLADGNPSEYGDLSRAGVVMIASDTPVVAQRAIGDGYRRCFQ